MKILRWKYVDPWLRKCPHCGDITQYPDDICYKCQKEVSPCKIKQAEG